MVKQVSVKVSGSTVSPNPVSVAVNDQIVWINQGSSVIGLLSSDGGVTFTTGPIQPGQQSLPITMMAPNPGLAYISNPPGVKGKIIVTGYAVPT